MQAGLKPKKMCKYFHVQVLNSHPIKIYTKEVLLSSNLSSPGHNHVGLLFTMKSQKRETDLILSSHILALFTMLLTDGHKMVALKVTFLQVSNIKFELHISTIFKRQFLTNNWQKNCSVSVFFITFLLIGPVMFLPFGFPFSSGSHEILYFTVYS